MFVLKPQVLITYYQVSGSSDEGSVPVNERTVTRGEYRAAAPAEPKSLMLLAFLPSSSRLTNMPMAFVVASFSRTFSRFFTLIIRTAALCLRLLEVLHSLVSESESGRTAALHAFVWVHIRRKDIG